MVRFDGHCMPTLLLDEMRLKTNLTYLRRSLSEEERTNLKFLLYLHLKLPT